jgi:hypothetical protein
VKAIKITRDILWNKLGLELEASRVIVKVKMEFILVQRGSIISPSANLHDCDWV